MSESPQWVAVAVVVVRDDRVLTLRRATTNDVGAGIWETPSGRARAGEDPLDAAKREVVEETGLDVAIEPRPIDAYAMRRGEVPMTVIVYRARWHAGEVRLSDEHDEHAWRRLDELEERGVPRRLRLAIGRAFPELTTGG